eukprot:5513405-Prymnesium_polylepis.1
MARLPWSRPVNPSVTCACAAQAAATAPNAATASSSIQRQRWQKIDRSEPVTHHVESYCLA